MKIYPPAPTGVNLLRPADKFHGGASKMSPMGYRQDTNPAVVDTIILHYDGRHRSKEWIILLNLN